MWNRLQPHVHHELCWFPSSTGQQHMWARDFRSAHKGHPHPEDRGRQRGQQRLRPATEPRSASWVNRTSWLVHRRDRKEHTISPKTAIEKVKIDLPRPCGTPAIPEDPQSQHDPAQPPISARPASSTTRRFPPSGSAASVRKTAPKSLLRQIDVVRRSPGKTGAVKVAARAVSRVGSPSHVPRTSTRPAIPYVHRPCRMVRGKPAFCRANHGSLCSGFRSPDSR